MTYKNTGTEPKVVLLHGFLESTSMWEGFIKTAAENNVRCINISIPNHLPEEKASYLNN